MRKIILLFVLASLTSCSVLINSALTSYGIYDDEVELIYLKSEDKEVLLVPNKHIGSPHYYENLKNTSDSLIQNGYFFFYEKAKVEKLETQEDSIKLKDGYLKIRRILGTSISMESEDAGIIDTINNKLWFGNKSVEMKKKLVNQPKTEYFFENENDFENVDMFISEILDRYESKFGKVVLTDCDYQTAINEPYYCNRKEIKKENKRYFNRIIIEDRNNHVINELLKSEHKKIAVIYGAAHMDGMKALLEENGFK